MAEERPPSRFAFLYRQGDGVIGARQWAKAAWPPAAMALVVVALWALASPPAPIPLSERQLAEPGAVLALAYFIAYSFAAVVSVFIALLLAVAEYFVCAKRFRDRGLPAALAGVAPFSILLAGAAHWYVLRAGDPAIGRLPYLFDALAIAACGWTVFELGFGDSRSTH